MALIKKITGFTRVAKAVLIATASAICILGFSTQAFSATGQITVVSTSGTKCLDVIGGSNVNGTGLQVWDCNGGAAQQWTYNAANKSLVNASGKCLDVPGATTANGTRLQIWDCNGGTAQQWTYTAPSGSLKNQNGSCLDDANDGGNGSPVQIWSCLGNQNQNWNVSAIAAPLPAPSCSSVAMQSSTTSAITGTLRTYAYGVQNATTVQFPTWGDTGGQDDIIWYNGINDGGGTWHADIDLSRHKTGNPEYGTFHTHVYIQNSSSTVFCGSSNWTRTAPINGGIQQHISTSYTPPTGRQGLTDYYYAGSSLTSRYGVFRQFGLGAKIYNTFWSGYETATISGKPVMSSSSPIGCPIGYTLVPANQTQLLQLGYHRYRCMSDAFQQQWDNLFSLDRQNGIQTIVALWSAPPQYRNTGCQGTPWQGYQLYDSCVPSDGSMDDWEDYVNYLANRYSKNSPIGTISQFVVWNENNSAGWFDISSTGDTSVHQSANLSQAEIQKWITKYVDMMIRAHTAIARQTSGVLLHTNTDAYWTWNTPSTTYFDGNNQNIGAKTLLDGVWSKLGTSIDWSVAIHPYGDPVEPVQSNSVGTWINFQNASVVKSYQLSNLTAQGIKNPPSTQAQLQIAATEQGWLQNSGIDVQARNICEAQLLSERNSILTQTHLLFQDPDPNSDNNPNSQGLVRHTAGDNLSAGAGMSTFEAYRSTGYNSWEKSNGHYCCTTLGIGCATPVALPMSNATSNNTLWSASALVDKNYNTAYSSNALPSVNNTTGVYVAAWMQGKASNGWMVSSIKLHARMVSGVPYGFPPSYTIYLTTPDNSNWLSVQTSSIQPDATGTVTIQLPKSYRTYGTLIIPNVLWKDTNPSSSAYYFQLSEIELFP